MPGKVQYTGNFSRRWNNFHEKYFHKINDPRVRENFSVYGILQVAVLSDVIGAPISQSNPKKSLKCVQTLPPPAKGWGTRL